MLTGTGLLYGSVIGHSRKVAWGATPLNRLDPKDLWLIDRRAVKNWRPGLNDVREFFEPALSIGTLGTIATYGMISKKLNGNFSELATLGLMYFEGLYISTGTELLAKALINRPRPYTYNEDLSLEDRIRPGNNESFFSGNATIMFYNASFISLLAWDLYPDAAFTPYIIGGSFALAELSAIWSVRSGMHFPTDVITGAIWGSGVAFFINRLHRKGARGLNIMPWMIDKGRGIVIRYILD
jgi:membrane-associated phospholipid phosphatase